MFSNPRCSCRRVLGRPLSYRPFQSSTTFGGRSLSETFDQRSDRCTPIKQDGPLTRPAILPERFSPPFQAQSATLQLLDKPVESILANQTNFGSGIFLSKQISRPPKKHVKKEHFRCNVWRASERVEQRKKRCASFLNLVSFVIGSELPID